MRQVYALALVVMVALTACRAPEPAAPGAGGVLTDGLAAEHLPLDGAVPARVAWVNEANLVYTSRAGIEVLPAAGGQPATLAGSYWQAEPSPDGSRLAYWGEAGLGLAAVEPLQEEKVLWDAADLAGWARDQVGQGARFWVDEIHWSADGRQVAALLQAEGPAPERRRASALAAFDVERGERLMLWGRSGQEGLIRAFSWAWWLLVQYDNFPDKAGPHGVGDTSTLLLLGEVRDPQAQKPMGTLPYPLTLADVRGGTALFLPTRTDYAEPFPARPQVASVAMVGVQPAPVGEDGQTGLLSPRDGQFVPLGPGQERAAISPSGGRLAVLVPRKDGAYAIRLEDAPAAAAGTVDLEHALPVTVQTAAAPAGDGPPPRLTDVTFATEREGWGVTFDGAVVRTDDGGESWAQAFRAEGVEFYHILPAGAPAALFAAGRRTADSRPVLYTSADGGRTWSGADPAGLGEDAARVWPYLHFAFVSPQVGYAVPDTDANAGGPGMTIPGILVTRDGGHHWEARPLPEGVRPSGGISFATPERGFITASSKEGSQILATEDGGRTWKAVFTSKVPLYSVQLVDGQTGFAGGGNAPKYSIEPLQYLLRTEDGGATWEEAYRSDGRTGGPIAALRFSSGTEGWAALGVCTMGQNRPCGKALVYTRDGGRTWEGRGYAPYGWSAVGAAAWGVAGEPDRGQSLLNRTTDGGATWSPLWSPAAVAVRAVHFTDARNGWLQTNVGLYRTADGGRTWQPATLDAQAPPEAWPVFAGWQTLYLPQHQNLLRSDDDGRTWQTLTLPSGEPGGTDRVAFAGPADGWAIYTGKLYATHDGGRTWERLSPGLTDYVTAMAFGDARHGVAAAGRSLLLTADGGQTWSGRPLKDVSLYSADYRPDGHIWLAGQTSTGGREDGILLHSPDGGKSWTTYRGQAFGPREVSFPTAKDGWLAAYAAGTQALLTTHDGGATWQQVWPALPRR